MSGFDPSKVGVPVYDSFLYTCRETEEYFRSLKGQRLQDDIALANKNDQIYVELHNGKLSFEKINHSFDPEHGFGDLDTKYAEKDIGSVSQSAKEKMKGRRMNKEDKERALHLFFFLENLLPRGFHIIIYGAAGSGKTTVVLFLMKQLLIDHSEAEVYYLYLDGQLGMAANYELYLEQEGLNDRYNIITNGTADELMAIAEDLVKESSDPRNLVFVLDTLKFLNPDILSKSTNAKALHRIKALTTKGATFVTLHHTNKDGENFAGTAEIEQDSDALLKIVTMDGDEEHTKISTLEEGGRVRYFFEPQSFTFTRGDPASVAMLDGEVNTDKLMQQKTDASVITIIKGILTLEGTMTKTELEKLIKEDDDFDSSKRDLKNILKRYIDIHWGIKKTGERNQSHMYSVIDTASKSIESIQEKIGAP